LGKRTRIARGKNREPEAKKKQAKVKISKTRKSHFKAGGRAKGKKGKKKTKHGWVRDEKEKAKQGIWGGG